VQADGILAKVVAALATFVAVLLVAIGSAS